MIMSYDYINVSVKTLLTIKGYTADKFCELIVE